MLPFTVAAISHGARGALAGTSAAASPAQRGKLPPACGDPRSDSAPHG